MERSRKILLKITAASHRVVAAANEYADRKDTNGVPRYHFQLEDNMRRIAVACERLADSLGNPSTEGRGSNTVDVRLRDWLGTDEPEECLTTLSWMEALLRQDGPSWTSWISQKTTSSRDKIEDAVRLFGARARNFRFLNSDLADVENGDGDNDDRQRRSPSRSGDHVIQEPSTVVRHPEGEGRTQERRHHAHATEKEPGWLLCDDSEHEETDWEPREDSAEPESPVAEEERLQAEAERRAVEVAEETLKRQAEERLTEQPRLRELKHTALLEAHKRMICKLKAEERSKAEAEALKTKPVPMWRGRGQAQAASNATRPSTTWDTAGDAHPDYAPFPAVQGLPKTAGAGGGWRQREKEKLAVAAAAATSSPATPNAAPQEGKTDADKFETVPKKVWRPKRLQNHDAAVSSPATSTVTPSTDADEW